MLVSNTTTGGEWERRIEADAAIAYILWDMHLHFEANVWRDLNVYDGDGWEKTRSEWQAKWKTIGNMLSPSNYTPSVGGALTNTEFERMRGNGFYFSCATAARMINEHPRAKKYCFQVTCDQGPRIFKSDRKARKHVVFSQSSKISNAFD